MHILNSEFWKLIENTHTSTGRLVACRLRAARAHAGEFQSRISRVRSAWSDPHFAQAIWADLGPGGWGVLKGRYCIVQPTSFAVGMHRRADRYRSIAIVKGYRTVKILWPTDECRKSSRLYKWENRAIFSHFWRNLLAASTPVRYSISASDKGV